MNRRDRMVVRWLWWATFRAAIGRGFGIRNAAMCADAAVEELAVGVTDW